MLDVRTRVNNGVDLLDHYMPAWRGTVDANVLDVARPSQCVLGQMGDDDFSGMADSLAAQDGLSVMGDGYMSFQRWLAFHGFEGDEGRSMRTEYVELTEAWKAVLA